MTEVSSVGQAPNMELEGLQALVLFEETGEASERFVIAIYESSAAVGKRVDLSTKTISHESRRRMRQYLICTLEIGISNW